MKPIMIFGASLSTAALAWAFAVLADQAMPRGIAEMPTAPMPFRQAPDLNPDLARVIRSEAAQIARRAPIPTVSTASPGALSLRQPALAMPDGADHPGGLGQRPPRRAGLDLPSLDLAGMDPAQTGPSSAAPITAARFEYIPLVGVYR